MASLPPAITVIAGVNGAGKSSIVGAALRSAGGDYHNPDEVTKKYVAKGLSLADARSRAWYRGKHDLERAIADRCDLALETTLGGGSITGLLLQAASEGMRIQVLYVGLESPELHIQRVQARVARGGHDIPPETIRKRWESSRANLLRLIPVLSDFQLFDNSLERAPEDDHEPQARLLLEIRDHKITRCADPSTIPSWAKPIVMLAAKTLQ